ncbi:MAG: hypothetical protein J0L69_15615 [Bacteroidetes bacterium]|nr:hypothetical protein [Bacteroidota bacterium]
MIQKIKLYVFRVLKFFALAFLIFVISLFIEHNFSTELPKPTGVFPVGRSELRIKSNKYQYAIIRESFAWVWYPSSISSVPNASYLPANWMNALNQHKFFLSNLINRDLSKVHPHSLSSSPISDVKEKYPIILFRGGLATLAPEYSTLCENWASHGYIVVGIDAPLLSRLYIYENDSVVKRPNRNNPEVYTETLELYHTLIPRLVNEWTSVSSITLDYLDSLSKKSSIHEWSGRMDLNKVAMIGHSLGGAVALQFCQNDSRCKTAINIDGLLTPSIVNNGLSKPTMFIFSEHSKSDDTNPLNIKIRSDIQFIQSHSNDSLLFITEYPTANHYNFSDGALTKSHLLMSLLRLFGVVKESPNEQLSKTATITNQFLDKNL